jgi:hypothetical protein
MQLYTLDGTSFQPNGYIQGYSSLIWTERYLPAGEFQLVTAKPDILQQIPPGTYLCIQDSGEIMMVETHNLRRNEEGYPETVVTGRSVDAVLDERVIWGPHGTTFVTPRAYTNQDAALVSLWGVIANSSQDDVMHTTLRPGPLVSGSYIPNVVITDSSPASTDSSQKYSIQIGPAGEIVRAFIANDDLGIRTIRPGIFSKPAKLVTVSTTNGANKGAITKTPTNTFTAARMDVFKGTDRTRGQTAVPPVVFVAAAGHLVNVEVLDSDRDFATQLVITTPAKTYASSSPYVKPPAGFNTKVRYLDGSELVKDLDLIDADLVINAYAKRYWFQHSGQAFLDGDVSDTIPFKYGVDYSIGDAVTLQYNNLIQTMWVSEFTRAEDTNGERAYPTFATTPSSESRGLQRL